jgi:uncharacterized protein (DUF4415 family)
LGRVEFDAAKNAANIRERGLAFEQVVEFDFAGALVKRDDRKAYPEVRFLAIGLLGGRLHVPASRRCPEESGSSASGKPTLERPSAMNKRPPLTDAAGEVRELTQGDLAQFKPSKEALPEDLYDGLVRMNRRAGVRGPQKAPLKQATTIRFDADVLAALKATGKGWQTRVNDAMREWVKTRR